MQLALLTALVMVAFASNSILNRAALTMSEIGALDFALIRMVSGAVALAAIVVWRSGGGGFRGQSGWVGPGALLLYMIGFSLAYLDLDAGIGALILFGGVQVTMFAGGLWSGERPPPKRWAGTLLALVGLAWMVWPGGETQVSLGAAALMGAAALGWGLYSLHGRGSSDPLAATATNFLLTTPLIFLLWLVWPGAGERIDGLGVVLGIVAGAITSGLGYALWYAVLPRLDASVAALSQLTVPVIALAGGVALLSERVTWDVALPAALVLVGVALGLIRRPLR